MLSYPVTDVMTATFGIQRARVDCIYLDLEDRSGMFTRVCANVRFESPFCGGNLWSKRAPKCVAVRVLQKFLDHGVFAHAVHILIQYQS